MERAIRSAMPDFPPPADLAGRIIAAAESLPTRRQQRVNRWRLALGGALAAFVLVTGTLAILRGTGGDGRERVTRTGRRLAARVPPLRPEPAAPAAAAPGPPGLPGPVGAGPGVVHTDDQAIRIAAQYLGIQDLSKPKVSVEEVVRKDDRTSFEREWVEGRECYLVKFTGVEVRVHWGKTGYRIVPVHGLNVLIAAGSGKLLKVWSAEELDKASRERAVAEVEALVKTTGSERWTGLPDTPPKVSLLQALRQHSPGFEQVDAYYVTTLEERPADPLREGAPTATVTRPTWQILIARRGEPFSPRSGPSLRPEPEHPDEVYFCYQAVDAETGTILIDEHRSGMSP